MIAQFLRTCDASGGEGIAPQVVSLGGGLDSTFFCLAERGKAPAGGYYEVDLPEVVALKRARIATSPALLSLLDHSSSDACGDTIDRLQGGEQGQGAGEEGMQGDGGNGPLHRPTGGRYQLLAADLRDASAVVAALDRAGVSRVNPTLFISEVVLIYMAPEAGTALIQQIAAAFACAAFLTYEQIHPHDPFGSMMVSNIAARGCPLLAIHAFPDLSAQVQRYKDAGWQDAEGLTMEDMYEKVLAEDERARVARVEWLDEVSRVVVYSCVRWCLSLFPPLSLPPFSLPLPLVLFICLCLLSPSCSLSLPLPPSFAPLLPPSSLLMHRRVGVCACVLACAEAGTCECRCECVGGSKRGCTCYM